MILVMRNDYVTIYDMSEEEFESLDELSNLENYEIGKVLKNDFSSEWLTNSLGETAKKIKCYYYDNGSKLVKKEIEKISDINYYIDKNGRLWPSLEYYKMTEQRADLDPILERLIKRDYKLNNSRHINSLLTLEQREAFIRYYDKLYINSNSDIVGIDMVGKAYEVPCYCKLILKDDAEKLSSGKLDGCVFLISIPAGIDENNETIFFFYPYKITKSDTKSFTKIYRQILNEHGLKSEDLAPDERVPYFEETVKKYLKDEIYTLVSSIQIGGTSYTWADYRDIFINEYGFALDESLNNWDVFEKKLIDARLVEDGEIVPLVVEYSREFSYKRSLDAIEEINRLIGESENDSLTPVSPTTLDLFAEENASSNSGVPENKEEVDLSGVPVMGEEIISSSEVVDGQLLTEEPIENYEDLGVDNSDDTEEVDLGLFNTEDYEDAAKSGSTETVPLQDEEDPFNIDGMFNPGNIQSGPTEAVSSQAEDDPFDIDGMFNPSNIQRGSTEAVSSQDVGAPLDIDSILYPSHGQSGSNEAVSSQDLGAPLDIDSILYPSYVQSGLTEAVSSQTVGAPLDIDSILYPSHGQSGSNEDVSSQDEDDTFDVEMFDPNSQLKENKQESGSPYDEENIFIPNNWTNTIPFNRDFDIDVPIEPRGKNR